VLALPDVSAAVDQARASFDGLRARPEYEQFRLTRERLSRQGDVVAAGQRPLVSAFGRGGYGKPGLNFIDNQWEFYGFGGVQLQWKAWTWGIAGREQEALGLQQRIVEADEEAFTSALQRAVQTDLGTIDRLQETIALDDQIISARELVERTTSTRFQEGVVTASEYLDRGTELLAARLARTSHQVELAQASARFLTTLGLEVR
jgi:outer membrane protein TolC